MLFNQIITPNRTTVDVIGSSYGVDRIHNEPLYDYVERIYDRYRNPDNTTYDGIVSRISRKLGLMNFYPIEIYLKPTVGPTSISGPVSVLDDSLTDTGAAWTDDEFVGKILQVGGVNFQIIENDATTIYVNTVSLEDIYNSTVSPTYQIFEVTNPLISISQSRIRLYSNFIDDAISEIDFEMDINNYTLLSEVIDEINNNSPSFAVRKLHIRKYQYNALLARHLIPQNSLLMKSISGNNTNYHDFEVNNIVDDTLTCTSSGSLTTKKDFFSDVTASGDFHLDRFNGVLYSKNAILQGTNLSVRYNQIPFRPKASLIIIDDIRDPEYNRTLFTQVPQEIYSTIDEQYKNGKPLDQFFIDYRIMQKLNNIHWGK